MKFCIFKRKNLDERLIKESDEIFYVAYGIALIVAVLELVQPFFDSNIWIVSASLFLLVPCNLYIYIEFKRRGLGIKDLKKPKDEFIKESRNEIVRKAFYISFIFSLFICGVIFIVYLSVTNFNSVSSLKNFESMSLFVTDSYLLWLIPALYITVKIIRKGLFLTKPIKKNIKQSFNKTLVKASLMVFILFTALSTFMKFRTLGLEKAFIQSLMGGIFVGIFWGLFIKGVAILSEKRANKRCE
ncbi:MAG: hypothetical protein ACRCX8_07605 [Sarcina sp.]